MPYIYGIRFVMLSGVEKRRGTIYRHLGNKGLMFVIDCFAWPYVDGLSALGRLIVWLLVNSVRTRCYKMVRIFNT